MTRFWTGYLSVAGSRSVLNQQFEALCDVLLNVGRYMQRIGLIDGYLAVVEPNLSFWPEPSSPFHWWSGIDHALLPHVHFLICGQQPLGPEVMAVVYNFLQSSLGSWSYANLWFNPVKSQAQIRKSINYAVKPWPVADWYRHALLAGCDPNNLNLSFDEIALETCSGLFALVHSPRRAGVLATNSGARCILDPVPPYLTRKEISMCQDERFYRAHEESFWRTVEKRQVRMGRAFRCRNMTHRTALRRIRSLDKVKTDTLRLERADGFLSAELKVERPGETACENF